MLTCCGKTPAMSVLHLHPDVQVAIECLECLQWEWARASTEDDAKRLAAEQFVILQRKLALRSRWNLRAEREVERHKALEEVAKIAVELLRNDYIMAGEGKLEEMLVKAGYTV